MRPENTIPAFEYAIGLGVDVLELDMAVSLDDEDRSLPSESNSSP